MLMTFWALSVRPSVRNWKRMMRATRAKIIPNWRVSPPKTAFSLLMMPPELVGWVSPAGDGLLVVEVLMLSSPFCSGWPS
jgi:hypothetical protein